MATPIGAFDVATCAYKEVGRLPLKADVYTPANRPDGRRSPAVMWVHGGALVLGTRKDIVATRAHELKLFLDEGWTVVSIDYRLAPESRVPDIWEDVKDAFAWARGPVAARFNIDPSRVAAVGPSSGGYLSLLSGALLMPPPAAIVSWFGYGDITAAWYTEPDRLLPPSPLVPEEDAWASVGTDPVADLPDGHQRRNFYDFARQRGLRAKLIGGESGMNRFSPQFLVGSQFPPTMLIHGDADTAVPLQQSVAMAAALAAREIPHELIVVRGAPHSFDRAVDDAVARDAIDRSMTFLRQRLR